MMIARDPPIDIRIAGASTDRQVGMRCGNANGSIMRNAKQPML